LIDINSAVGGSSSIPIMKLVLCAAFFASQAVLAAEPPPSLTQYRCYVCHADREALAGPPFAEIAASYRGERDAVPKIANDIRAGIRTGGPWHMPPHPEVSREEARAMARYIMSLAPQDTSGGGPKRSP
jgi:cytochrome c